MKLARIERSLAILVLIAFSVTTLFPPQLVLALEEGATAPVAVEPEEVLDEVIEAKPISEAKSTEGGSPDASEEASREETLDLAVSEETETEDVTEEATEEEPEETKEISEAKSTEGGSPDASEEVSREETEIKDIEGVSDMNVLEDEALGIEEVEEDSKVLEEVSEAKSAEGGSPDASSEEASRDETESPEEETVEEVEEVLEQESEEESDGVSADEVEETTNIEEEETEATKEDEASEEEVLLEESDVEESEAKSAEGGSPDASSEASRDIVEEEVVEAAEIEEIEGTTEVVEEEVLEETGDGLYPEVTYEHLETGHGYRYFDTGLKLTFNEIDNPVDSTLTVRQVRLSAEEVEELGAVSDIAYDITSNMENGTFRYTLELPIPEEINKHEEDLGVMYAESEEHLDRVVSIEEEKEVVTSNPDVIVFSDLDHFTLFLISSGRTVTTATAPGGTNYNVTQITKLQTSDDTRVTKTWDDSFAVDYFQEFHFDVDYPATSTITGVVLTVELMRQTNVDTLAVYTSTDDTTYTDISESVLPASPGAGGETTFNLDLFSNPTASINTVDEVNDFSFRIYGSLNGPVSTSTKSKTDLVELTVHTSDSAFLESPADDSYVSTVAAGFDYIWTPVAEATAYEFESCATDPGTSSCGSPVAEATTTTTSRTVGAGQTEGTTYWHVRAVFNDDTRSAWSATNKLTIDNTDPTDPTESALDSTSHTVSTPSKTKKVTVTWPLAGDTDGASDANGVDGYYYSFTEDATSTPGTTNQLTGTDTSVQSSNLSDGNWYFNLATFDVAGNRTNTVHIGPFVIETVPPAIPTHVSPADNATTSTTIVFDWTDETDPNGPVEYRFQHATDPSVNGKGRFDNPVFTSSWLSASTYTDTLAEGTSYWSVRSRDALNNRSDWSSAFKVVVDGTAPVVTISEPVTNDATSTSFTISGSSSDTVAGVDTVALEYSTDGGSTWTAISTLTNSSMDEPYNWSTTWTPGSEDTYTVRASSTDKVGNVSSDSVNPVYFDRTDPTDPTVTSTSHTVSTGSADNTIDLSISGASDDRSGVAGFSYLWDTSASTLPDETIDAGALTSTHTSPALADGDSHYFHLRTVDNAGNWTSTVHVGPFVIDTTPPPTPAHSSPADGSFNQNDVTFDWSDELDTVGPVTSAPVSYEISIDSGTPVAVTASEYTTTLTEGSHTWKVRSKDALGNTSGYSTMETITVDDTAPTTTWTAPAADSFWNVPIVLSGKSTDTNNITKVRLSYSDDGGATWSKIKVINNTAEDNPWSWSYTWTPPTEDTFKVRVRAFDKAGNKESWNVLGDVTYDKTKPMHAITAPADDSFHMSPLTVSGITNDTLSGVDTIRVRVRDLNDGDKLIGTFWPTYSAGSGGAWSIDLSSTDVPDGYYKIVVRALDKAGNTKFKSVVNVRVDNVAPVITRLGDDPVTIEVHSPYVDAGATALDDIDGDITSSIVTVNPVDNSIVGTYTVTYNVSDRAGNTATEVTRTVNVVDTTPPVLTLLGDVPLVLPYGVDYVEPGATAIDNYDGDISSKIEITGTVNSTSPGDYVINYSVTDANGNTSTASRSVTVAPAGSGPVGGVGGGAVLGAFISATSGGGGGGGGYQGPGRAYNTNFNLAGLGTSISGPINLSSGNTIPVSINGGLVLGAATGPDPELISFLNQQLIALHQMLIDLLMARVLELRTEIAINN